MNQRERFLPLVFLASTSFLFLLSRSNLLSAVHPSWVSGGALTSSSKLTRLGFGEWKLSQADLLRSRHHFQNDSMLAKVVNKKKILLLGHELFFAGGEIWLRNLGQLLEDSGATVRFLFLIRQNFHNPLLRLHENFSYIFWEESRQWIDFSGFDFVIANTAAVEEWHHFFERVSEYTSAELMLELNAKTVYCIHELNATSSLEHTPFLRRQLPLVRNVIFPSKSGLQQWQEQIPEISTNSKVVPPAVPEDRIEMLKEATINQEVNRKMLDIPAAENDVIILQVSTLQRAKGIFDLIAAFELLVELGTTKNTDNRAYFLVLVGPCVGNKTEINTMIEKAHNSFTQLNQSRSRIIVRQATNEIAPLYGAADVFVLNSFCENFGMVLVEAMFSGRPAIGRNCGGPAEIIDDGITGRLLPGNKDNPDELSRYLFEMTRHAGWKKELGILGQRGAEKAYREYSIRRMAELLADIFDPKPKSFPDRL